MRPPLARMLFLIVLMSTVRFPLVGAERIQTNAKIARSGTTVLKSRSPIGEVTLSIHTSIFDRSCACSCPAAWALKELKVKDIIIIEGLEISVEGKPVPVPDSVYDHLFNPHEASVQFKNGSFVLRIDGMDASNSYFVRIFFDRNGVSRMLTYWGLVPDKPMSDTRFYNVQLEDSP